jgi:long-subunit acyl-CoA synthetase (AMP-forming)
MSHQNVVNAMLGYTGVTTFYENDVYMAYLPLAHVLELISGTEEMFQNLDERNILMEFPLTV